MNFIYGLLVGFALGMVFIMGILSLVGENKYFNEGWRQAEIHYLKNGSMKFGYELTVDSTYTQKGE